MTRGLSKDSAICKHCPNYDNCSNKKRMEACAYLVPEQALASPFAESMAEPMIQEMAVKHDFRNIKIAENTTVTIDLEELKKKLEEDFYKQLGCGFLMED